MMKSYGLILAGGGAKGAYQMGAWRAMRELGVQFSAIAGVSIGAINGALIVQNDYDKAMELWNTVEVQKGVNIAAQLKDPNNLFSRSNYPQLLREMIKNKGLDASPTKALLQEYIDEEKVRAGNIPFGMVTFQLSGLKPVEIFLDEMPQGELFDYLMASARFPGINRQGPADGNYLDGGVYDNAPIDTLRKRGINRMVVVDISGMKGFAHKNELSCMELIYIRPSVPNELGASFDFDRETLNRRMEMGYLDTRKAFGLLKGELYYFEERDFFALADRFGFETLNQLEKLAYQLEIPRLQIYSAEEFANAVCAAGEKELEAPADSLTKKLSRYVKEQELQKAYDAVRACLNTNPDE